MDKKTLLAFFLIAIVLILMPYYMKIVAPPEQPESTGDPVITLPAPQAEATLPKSNIYSNAINDVTERTSIENVQQYADEQTVSVETELYSAILSSRNGGSFTSFILKKYKATDSTSVQLVDNFNNDNLLFEAISVDGVPLILSAPWNLVGSNKRLNVADRSKSLTFTTNVLGKNISKTLTFNPSSYKIDVSFDLSEIRDQISQGIYSLSWNGGLPATEKNLKDELFYYKAYVYQGDELSSEKLRKDKTLDEKYRGQTNWVGTRNKYFLTAIIPVDNAVGASLRGTYESDTPQFDVSINQQINSSNSFTLYLGPLEYKNVSSLGVNLEQTMSMGFAFSCSCCDA